MAAEAQFKLQSSTDIIQRLSTIRERPITISAPNRMNQKLQDHKGILVMATMNDGGSTQQTLNQSITQNHPSAQLPSKNQAQAKFDLAITLILAQWPALALAVQNEWGGPDSADKRDWFAGALSDLFATQSNSLDIQDVEEMLLQVMADEFEVAIEDGSEVEIAQRVWVCWVETGEGRFERVDRMWAEYQAKGSRKDVKIVQGRGEDDEDSNDEDVEDEEGDVDMDEAPELVPARERAPPEVDDDGFTKVVGRRKR